MEKDALDKGLTGSLRWFGEEESKEAHRGSRWYFIIVKDNWQLTDNGREDSAILTYERNRQPKGGSWLLEFRQVLDWLAKRFPVRSTIVLNQRVTYNGWEAVRRNAIWLKAGTVNEFASPIRLQLKSDLKEDKDISSRKYAKKDDKNLPKTSWKLLSHDDCVWKPRSIECAFSYAVFPWVKIVSRFVCYKRWRSDWYAKSLVVPRRTVWGW